METLSKPKPMRLHLILNVLEKDHSICVLFLKKEKKKKKERKVYKYTMVMWKIL